AESIPSIEHAWLYDHLMPQSGNLTDPCLEGWTLLAAFAAVTKRLRLGLTVSSNTYRHPAVLANMAATVDIISNGRLELGIGAGWNDEECDAYGIELGTLTERFDRFDEACEVIVSLLSNRVTNFEGRYFNLDDAYCEPKPVQRAH